MSSCIRFIPLLIIILAARSCQSQYGGGNYQNQEPHYPAQGDYYGNNGGDERPKVHLGIRLRIPAFKFELPRMSLPKVTIKAKIRQPDRPRTINLPEINLDTSSRVAAPHPGNNYGGGGGGGGGSYGYGAANTQHQMYQQPDYGGGDKSGEISFTTEEDSSYSGQHQPTNGYASGPMHQAPGYSATNIHPSYQNLAHYQLQQQNRNMQLQYQHQQQHQQHQQQQQQQQQLIHNQSQQYVRQASSTGASYQDNQPVSGGKEDSDYGFEPSQARPQHRVWTMQNNRNN